MLNLIYYFLPLLKKSSIRTRHLLFFMQKAGLLIVVSILILLGLEIPNINNTSLASSILPHHLRLLDRLDRPEDGYCVDILGAPGNLRTDVPLFAHNCKLSLTVDSAVVFTDDGLIKFPAVNRCLTVAGVNSSALPGASILLRKCNETLPFF